MQLLLLLSFVAVCSSLRVGPYSSRCFEESFESRYNDFGRLGKARIGVTAYVDKRYIGKVTSRTIATSVNALNKALRSVKIELYDLKVYELAESMLSNRVFTDHKGMGSYVSKTMHPKWLANSHIKGEITRGRLVFIFAHVGKDKGHYVGGHSPVAQLAPRRYPFVWMNVDPFRRFKKPYFSDRSFMHEVGHNLGLFHTFASNTNHCKYGDMIPDTPPALVTFKGCGHKQDNGCNQVTTTDTSNLMSYGTCGKAQSLTTRQIRRVRCVIENAHSLRFGASSTPAAPSRASGGSTTGNNRLRHWGQCNGMDGLCVNKNDCGGKTYKNRCPGPGGVQCCPSLRSVVVSDPLPGVGSQCYNLDGSCLDAELSQCASGFVRGRCPGPAQVQCCRTDSSEVVIDPEYTAVIDVDNLVNITETMFFEDQSTVHVGQKLVLGPMFLTGAKAYLWETEALEKVDVSTLAEHEIEFRELGETAVEVEFTKLKNGSPIDRGQYSLVFQGTDDESGNAARTLYSTVFTIDVDSCALSTEQATFFGVPYGVVRTPEVCQKRGDEAAGPAGEGLVCCVPFMDTNNIVPVVTFSPTSDELLPDGAEAEELMPADMPDSDGLYGSLEWRGETFFWGAKVIMKRKDAPDSKLDFVLREVPTTSAAPVTTGEGVAMSYSKTVSSLEFTPRVAAPGSYQLSTDDGIATPSFSIVTMPCLTQGGKAGYCKPVSFIANAVNNEGGVEAGDNGLCASGDRAPCSGLSMPDGAGGSIAFACCAGEATEFQRQANYRTGGSSNSEDNESSAAVAGASAALVATAVAARFI